MADVLWRPNVPDARILSAAILLAFAPVLSAAETRGQAGERGLAVAILEAGGVRGGLIVHLGCGDGVLTAELAARESFFVHGLDNGAANVASA